MTLGHSPKMAHEARQPVLVPPYVNPGASDSRSTGKRVFSDLGKLLGIQDIKVASLNATEAS